MLAGLADAGALLGGLDSKTVRGARTKRREGAAPAGGDDPRVRAVLARRTWTTKSQTSMHCIMSAMSPCAKTPQRLRAGSSAQVITAVRNTTVTVLRVTRVHRHSSWLALGRAEPRQAHSSPRVSHYELDQAEPDAAGGPVNDSPEEFEIRPSADQLP